MTDHMMTTGGEQELYRPGSPSRREGGNPEPSGSKCDEPPVVITPRQYEVLWRRANGQTLRTICADLGIGRWRYYNLVKEAADRLGVPGEGETACFRAIGWLIVPPW